MRKPKIGKTKTGKTKNTIYFTLRVKTPEGGVKTRYFKTREEASTFRQQYLASMKANTGISQTPKKTIVARATPAPQAQPKTETTDHKVVLFTETPMLEVRFVLKTTNGSVNLSQEEAKAIYNQLNAVFANTNSVTWTNATPVAVATEYRI